MTTVKPALDVCLTTIERNEFFDPFDNGSKNQTNVLRVMPLN